MSNTLAETQFKQALLACLDETFEKHHGIFLNRGTSFFETLERVTPEQASQPIGGKSASIAAQVAHTTFYLDVLERYMLHQPVGDVDWDEIWRTVSKVTPAEWRALRDCLRSTYARVLKSIESVALDDEKGANGALAMLVHTAYHLGGVRQALCTLR
jgi:hypothetical protein